MLRAVLIFAVAALGAGLIAFLVDHPGWLAADWFGYHFEAPMSLMAAVLFLGFIALYLLLRFFGLILRTPAALRAASGRQRAREGVDAVTQGLAAAAGGEATTAHRQAARAGRLVKDSPLANVLALETAKLEGNKQEMSARATALTHYPDTELMGRRALFDLAVDRGDRAEADQQAAEAFTSHPAASWAAEALIAKAIAANDFEEAGRVHARAARHRAFLNGRGDRIKGAILLAEAYAARDAGDIRKALGAARRAREADADLVAAHVLAARLQAELGHRKRADQIVESAWPLQPHPELGAVYLEKHDSVEDRFAAALSLANENRAHVESELLLARAAIDARHAGDAHRALAPLLAGGDSARAFALRSELERLEYGAAASPEKWVDLALTAPRDAVWLCGTCGHQAPQWHAVCPDCHSVGTAKWATHGDVPSAEPAAPAEVIAAADQETPPPVEDLPPLAVEQAEASAEPEEEDFVPPPPDVPRQPDDPGPDDQVELNDNKGKAPRW